MKCTKPALLSLVILFAVLGCVTTKASTTRINKPRKHQPAIPYHPNPIFDKERLNSNGSINLNDVINHWAKLSIAVAGENMCIAIFGNPKLDWTKWDRSKDPLKRNIPRGERASAVSVGFIHRNERTDVAGFGYVDEYGADHYFVWDEKVQRYIRTLNPESQRAI